jgi:hypothetical protein
MSTGREHDGPHEVPRRPGMSGVRTEHDLRMQLRHALERNTMFERALRESAAFAYGPRDIADLRKLRAVLSAAGFQDPNARRGQAGDGNEPAPPAQG